MEYFDFSPQLGTGVLAVLSKRFGDAGQTVEQERRSVTQSLNISYDSLAIPQQIHSANVKYTRIPGIIQQTDGVVTQNPSVTLSLQVADCVPLFLLDEELQIRGLIHAGWRGAVAQIATVAISLMVERGARLQQIKGYLGPAIQYNHYTVGKEVAAHFHSDHRRHTPLGWQVDLYGQITMQLMESGVLKENIGHSTISTFESNECHSFRRDGDKAGRMIAILKQVQ